MRALRGPGESYSDVILQSGERRLTPSLTRPSSEARPFQSHHLGGHHRGKRREPPPLLPHLRFRRGPRAKTRRSAPLAALPLPKDDRPDAEYGPHGRPRAFSLVRPLRHGAIIRLFRDRVMTADCMVTVSSRGLRRHLGDAAKGQKGKPRPDGKGGLRLTLRRDVHDRLKALRHAGR